MTKAEKNHSGSIPRRLPFNHGISSLIMLLLFLQLSPYATAQFGAPPPPSNAFSYSPKFSSSMAVILVVLISAFFFLGFFSVYIRHCIGSHIRGSFHPTAIGGTGRRSRRVARGLDAEVIGMFPTFVYSTVKGLKIGKGSLECAVCLNEFEDNETLRLLPKCNHVFHPDCIDAWLACHITCPVCRANLVPKPGDLSYTATLIFDSESESDEPARTHNTDDSHNEVLIRVADDTSRVNAQSPEVNVRSPSQLITNQNRPPRSRSTRFRITGKFPRSHSTGHSLVQPGEDCERFTLRLPEEVRSQIMNSSLNRAKSCVAFPRVMSSRRGYRSGSSRGKNYERFDREERSERWGFSMTPPFFSRTASVRSQKVGAGEEVAAAAAATATTPKTLLESVKSPFDRLVLGKDSNSNVGERSSDPLRSVSPV
ncbi:hypothetical protein L1049_026967 [Liquidambar formosana]|uniref:RING-type E3 ubiquitin transferase n=1 Tax=Liquidambar formosana TaxID=63359 RepID=A0AAP0R622_LIQFO